MKLPHGTFNIVRSLFQLVSGRLVLGLSIFLNLETLLCQQMLQRLLNDQRSLPFLSNQ